MIVRRAPDGAIADVTPPGINARTLVHEYGGGTYVLHGATVIFSDFDDQRLYRQDLQEEPRAGARAVRAAGAHHAGAAGGARPALRGRTHHARRPPAGMRARAPRARRRRDQRAGRPARRRHGDAGGDRRRPRLLLQPAHQPRRPPPGLAQLGPPVHAVGRHRAVGRRTGRRRHPAQRAAGRRRARRIGGAAAMESRRRAALRLRPVRLVEPVPGDRRGHGGARPDGRRVRRASLGLRAQQLRVPARRAHRLLLQRQGLRPAGCGRARRPPGPHPLRLHLTRPCDRRRHHHLGPRRRPHRRQQRAAHLARRRHGGRAA